MKKYELTAMANVTPQPPPPPPTTQKSRKTLIVIILIAIIVVAAIVLAFLLMGGGTTNPTPSPGASATPSPGTSASPGSVTPTPTQTNMVGTATSLQFSVTITHEGVSEGGYTYYAKNAGTDNLMIRIDYTSTSGSFIYIVNGAQQKAWMSSEGQWTDLSSSFASQWDTWHSTYEGYVTGLGSWAGTGDQTYTSGGDTYRIYNISVNPSLPDSLFQP